MTGAVATPTPIPAERGSLLDRIRAYLPYYAFSVRRVPSKGYASRQSTLDAAWLKTPPTTEALNDAFDHEDEA